MKYATVNNWTFESLNASTVKAGGFIHNYKRADITDIYDAYVRPSRAKVNAFYNIVQWSMALENPTPVYITGKNSMIFTAAVEGTFNGARYLFYFTGYNAYAIAL